MLTQVKKDDLGEALFTLLVDSKCAEVHAQAQGLMDAFKKYNATYPGSVRNAVRAGGLGGALVGALVEALEYTEG